MTSLHRVGIVVFGSDWGMCGQFNERIANYTQATMNENSLAAALFRQCFFVSLYRACAESLKSENTSRLTEMQMAEKNIAERLTELSMEFNQQQQTTITEELLDIVSGFEALTNSK